MAGVRAKKSKKNVKHKTGKENKKKELKKNKNLKMAKKAKTSGKGSVGAAGAWTDSGFMDVDEPVGAKKDQTAKGSRGGVTDAKRSTFVSTDVKNMVLNLVKTHGLSYKKMSQDVKNNYKQLSQGQLKRAVRKMKLTGNLPADLAGTGVASVELASNDVEM